MSGVGGNGGAVIDNSQLADYTGPAGGAGGGTIGDNGSSTGDFTGGSGGGGSGYVNTAGNTNTSTSNAVKSGNGQIVITRTCL